MRPTPVILRACVRFAQQVRARQSKTAPTQNDPSRLYLSRASIAPYRRDAWGSTRSPGQESQMSRSSTHSGTLVLLAASFLAVALGSIHAFSVLVPSLENHFDAPRALVSATYSLALGSLTVAVLFGHRVFACFSASRFVLLICAVAALGALIAATAPSLPIV